jgi:hypothetical protein
MKQKTIRLIAWIMAGLMLFGVVVAVLGYALS